MKFCNKCSADKPVADFYKNRSMKGGFSRYCKECCNKAIRKSRARAKNTSETQICSRCKQDLPLDSFAKGSNRNGRHGKCRDCAKKHRSDVIEVDGIKYVREMYIKYRLSIDRYNKMFNKHDGMCWICKISNFKLSVDHDHNCCPNETSCGDCIRGLLCHLCNVGIGSFKDKTHKLEAAIKYLADFDRPHYYEY